VTQRKSSARCL